MICVACIKCGAEDAVTIEVGNGLTLHCGECSEEYTTDDVHEHIGGWLRVIRWAESHPDRVKPRVGEQVA